ncbi:MAG: 16S rRNA (uracil(1498)-N(3))-methyltransferase [Betaproteobacteria bacterium]|jgi:16S rRNA (uracil1498-N3)-methyltransferase
MSHFYLPEDFLTTPIKATDDLSHHLRVRRIQADENIQVFNGKGWIANAQIAPSSSEKSVWLDLKDVRKDLSKESDYPLVLIQGLAGSDKMDWLIEKSVELGVTHILPIQTERSVVRLDEGRAKKRLTHWENLVISACEQCERSVLPSVLPIMSSIQNLDAVLTKLESGSLKIILSPTGQIHLVSILKRAPKQGLILLIGPEGGLSQAEENLAIASGFTPALLGQRILRTETAGIVAMSAAHAVWGGF